MKYTTLLFGALCATSAFCSQQAPLQAPLIIRLNNKEATLEQKNRFNRMDTLGPYDTSKLFFELTGAYGKEAPVLALPSKDPEFFSLADYLAPGNDEKKQKVEQLYNVRRLDKILLIHANIGINPTDLKTKYFIANNS